METFPKTSHFAKCSEAASNIFEYRSSCSLRKGFSMCMNIRWNNEKVHLIDLAHSSNLPFCNKNIWISDKSLGFEQCIFAQLALLLGLNLLLGPAELRLPKMYSIFQSSLCDGYKSFLKSITPPQHTDKPNNFQYHISSLLLSNNTLQGRLDHLA